MFSPSGLFGRARSFGVLLSFCLMMSCVHLPAPHRPSDWVMTPIDMKSAADSPEQARLQVIIAYGPVLPNHTALRLVCPDRPVLFWDPGGSYGVSDSKDVRRNDLIVSNPPDLEKYLSFIWQHSSAEVDVFEWDLTTAEAHELHDVLVNGTDSGHPAGRFTTFAAGGFCSMAVSDFLHRFAKKIMTVRKSFFLPQNLTRVLYTQSPKRVFVFQRKEAKVMYGPPRITSGDTK